MSTLPTNTSPVKLYAGIDLGLDKNVVQVIDAHGRKVARFSFTHDQEGYAWLDQRLEQLQRQQGAEQVLLGMEPTNYFWKLVAAHLEPRQQPYRLVNAYTVKKHREGNQLDRSKDDPRDGLQIAELMRMGKYNHTRLLAEPYASLREEARLYHRLLRDLARQKTLLRLLVGQTFPELRQVFRDLTTQTARAVLRRHAGADTIRGLSWEAFEREVRADLSGQRLAVRQVAQAYARARHSIGLRVGGAALQHAIGVHLETLALLEQQLASTRRRLIALVDQCPRVQVWCSLPGINKLVAALLLAEIGDPSVYRRAAQWIKLAGTQPTANRSGRFSASHTPMSKKGRGRLRTLLFTRSLRLSYADPGFRRVYQRLVTRPVNPLKKKAALGVLMNRLLRILWALFQHQTEYRAMS